MEEIGASFRAEFDDGREGAAEASGEGSANGAGPSPSAPGSPFGAGAPQPCLQRPFLRLPGAAGSFRQPPPKAYLLLRAGWLVAMHTRDARCRANALSGHCEGLAERAGCSLRGRASVGAAGPWPAPQPPGSDACPATGAPAKPLSPFGAAALGGGGFGAAGGPSAKAPGGPANPFSGAGGAKLFTENPARLSPTMEPDSFTERPWWQTITFGQIVRALAPPLLPPPRWCRRSPGTPRRR